MTPEDDEVLRALDQQLALLFGEILTKNNDLRSKLANALAAELAVTPFGKDVKELAGLGGVLDAIRDHLAATATAAAGPSGSSGSVAAAAALPADPLPADPLPADPLPADPLLAEMRDGFAAQQENFVQIAQHIDTLVAKAELKRAPQGSDAPGPAAVGERLDTPAPLVAATDAEAAPTRSGWRDIAIASGVALLVGFGVSTAWQSFRAPAAKPIPAASGQQPPPSETVTAPSPTATAAQRDLAWKLLVESSQSTSPDASLKTALAHACGLDAAACPGFDAAMMRTDMTEADRRRILFAILDTLHDGNCSVAALPAVAADQAGTGVAPPGPSAGQPADASGHYIHAARCLLPGIVDAG